MIKIGNQSNKKKLESIRYAESEALFTSIGDGAISTDEKGHITRINKAAKEMLGFTDDDIIIGKKYKDLIVSVDENNIPLEPYKRISIEDLSTHDSISKKVIYRRRRQSDQPIHVAMTASAIKHKNKTVGVVIIFRDISDDYKIDQMKNDFISLASHQLRTPLTSVITYSHMLLDGYMGHLNHDQERFIKTIIKSSNRMNGVIGSLMNISKIDNKAVEFNPKKTNINRILEGVFHENRIELEAKNIIYKNLTPQQDKIIILNDPILLTEIINNLVSNAVKYTNNDGSITAKAELLDHSVKITITDNGIGISTKNQDKIFDKFFRAPGVTKHETEGSGLGLYIVRGFLDIVGGSVRFRSIEGKGTVFELIIPDLNSRQAT